MSQPAENTGGKFESAIHARPLTLLNGPPVACETEVLKAAGARVALLGVPFDQANAGRSGANFGPKALREVSYQFLSYLVTDDLDYIRHFKLVDAGDVPVPVANLKRTHQLIEDSADRIRAAGALPFLIGGDHSITIAATRSAARSVPRMGHVSFDAHLDTADTVGGEPDTSASPTSRTAELPNVDPRNVVVVGVRGTLNPRQQIEYARHHGLTVITMDEVCSQGAILAAARAFKIASQGTDGIYVTFDTDGIDAAYAPGTTSPEPGGFTSREILQIARLAGQQHLVGVDVVELCPAYDPGGITARLVGNLVVQVLAGIARPAATEVQA